MQSSAVSTLTCELQCLDVMSDLHFSYETLIFREKESVCDVRHNLALKQNLSLLADKNKEIRKVKILV